jgi:type I restriction enzyme S subunit
MKTERISDSEDHITREAIAHSTASLIKAGSVLIVTRSGILRHTLPVAVSSVGVTVNQDLKALTPRNGIMAEYVAWALRAFGRDILNTCSKQGTTVNSVETAKLLCFEIPIAPPEQQRTIVAEIEKQFSRLDEAVANLKRVKVNLKRYKAAVLKAAVEGKLTEDWRKQHPNVEPASKLLERILAERRKMWNGRGKYKEPAESDTSTFPPLPKHWTYAPVGSFLIEPMCNGISVKGSMTPPGVPALRLNAMTETGFDYSKFRYIPIDAALAKELEVKTGDFFVSRGNGSLRLVGRGTVAQTPPCQCVFPDTMIRLRIAVAMGTSQWISTIWSAELIRRQIEKRVKTTAGIWKISQPELGSILVPVPPEAEQHCIVAEVERRLSVIDELEAAVQANLTRADRLRQSILSQAFTGQLPVQPSPQGSSAVPIDNREVAT